MKTRPWMPCLIAAALLALCAPAGALRAQEQLPPSRVPEGESSSEGETVVEEESVAEPDSIAKEGVVVGTEIPTVLGVEPLQPYPTKSAPVAVLSSAFFPALGQLYNEERFRTLLIFVWESYYIARIVRDGYMADFYKRHANALGEGETWRGMSAAELRLRFLHFEDRMRDYTWYFSALLIASMLDAYVFAHLYTFDAEDIRKPVLLPFIGPERGRVGLQFRFSF